MNRARARFRCSLSVGLVLFGLGCPTTYVVLGNDDVSGGQAGTVNGTAGTAGMGGNGGVYYFGDIGGTSGGGVGGVGGAAGAAGMWIGGAGGSTGFGGVGGASGQTGSCTPSEETILSCEPFLGSPRAYDYNSCLNQSAAAMGGVAGAAADICEGYMPCTYQSEGCLFYQTSGAAGSDSGHCPSAPGDAAWMQHCGGAGYYGEEILGVGGSGAAGAGGSAGGAGVGCDPATDTTCVAGAGGASGTGAGGVSGTGSDTGAAGGMSGAGAGGEAGG
jgi:hypothetical protein